jgi:hypothetical protein
VWYPSPRTCNRYTERDKAEPIRPTAICGNLGGVMRVGLITFHVSPRAPTSVCDHIKLQTFFDGAGLRYAAGLAGSAVICRSAYYLLGGALPSQHAVPSRPTGHLLRPTASRHRSWLHSFRNTQHRGPAACSRTKPLLCRCQHPRHRRYVALLRCVWDFFAKGKGTLAPIDPPRVLVVSGLYRFTRNPMYNGVLALTLGEAWLFGSVRVVERGHRRDDTRRQTPDAHPRRDRRVRARAHRGARQGGPPARQGAGQTPRTSTEGASDHRHPWGLCA